MQAHTKPKTLIFTGLSVFNIVFESFKSMIKLRTNTIILFRFLSFLNKFLFDGKKLKNYYFKTPKAC